ncbi:MAG: cation diffusion facilitator family transporter [Flavisolibacter sp.]
MQHSHASLSDHSGHSHGRPVVLTSVTNAFVVGMLLNFIFIIVEVVYGLSIHSLSLLSDAGHNLADVGSMALSLLAFKLLKVKSSQNYTYGYRKTTILTALLNAMVLLVSVGAIAYQALNHFLHPEPLPGKTIALIAGLGIIINGGSAMFFRKGKEKDLNVKSAYLHLLSDALVSLGLVMGGIVIYFTKWYWLDPALSIIIAATILISTWNLLRESLRLSLDGVPKDIDLIKIKEEALKIEGLKDIYHIHVWAISTAENAMTAHVVLNKWIAKEKELFIKNELRHQMMHLNIQHLTIETETDNSQLKEIDCP